MRDRIRFIAFIVYPVEDMGCSRAFYEGILGPACRGGGILDPDGNEIILHEKKLQESWR